MPGFRLGALLLVLSAGPAFGHGLAVVVTPVPPDRLRVEAGYDDGTPADGATAVVTDRAGREIGRGTLDERGVCEVACPPAGWVVTVDDGAGHRTSVSGEREVVASEGDRPVRWVAAVVGLAVIGGWVVWRMRSRR